jgi:hypothetical protein
LDGRGDLVDGNLDAAEGRDADDIHFEAGCTDGQGDGFDERRGGEFERTGPGDKAGLGDLQAVGAEGEVRDSAVAGRVCTEAVADAGGDVVELAGGLHGGAGGVADFEPELARGSLGVQRGNEAGKGREKQGGASARKVNHTCMSPAAKVCSGYFEKG